MLLDLGNIYCNSEVNVVKYGKNVVKKKKIEQNVKKRKRNIE